MKKARSWCGWVCDRKKLVTYNSVAFFDWGRSQYHCVNELGAHNR